MDTFRYLDGKFERGGRLKAGDLRRAASGGAFKERSQLALQRLLPFDRDFFPREPVRGAPVHLAALILIIEGKISVLLKDPDLAHLLGADPARGDVRDTAILEMEPRVRDVFAAAQDRHTHRVDGPN